MKNGKNITFLSLHINITEQGNIITEKPTENLIKKLTNKQKEVKYQTNETDLQQCKNNQFQIIIKGYKMQWMITDTEKFLMMFEGNKIHDTTNTKWF